MVTRRNDQKLAVYDRDMSPNRGVLIEIVENGKVIYSETETSRELAEETQRRLMDSALIERRATAHVTIHRSSRILTADDDLDCGSQYFVLLKKATCRQKAATQERAPPTVSRL
jgi:hypothetical protein